MTTLLLDPNAGTHFVGKIFVTPHACDRAVERLGVERSYAPMHVMDLLRKSALIDPDVIDEDGNPARMFAYKGTVFIVDREKPTVITLYLQFAAVTSIYKVITDAAHEAHRKAVQEARRLDIRKAELNVERAQCELARLTAENINIQRAYSENLAEIDELISGIDEEIYEVKRLKTSIARSLSAHAS